jgi:hypothetical protein
MEIMKAKDELLTELYNGTKQINIHLSDKPYVFHLVLLGRDKEPDFKISSFGANLWARTNKGINRQKYNSIVGIKKAVKTLIKNKVETEGRITFSISNEVYTF